MVTKIHPSETERNNYEFLKKCEIVHVLYLAVMFFIFNNFNTHILFEDGREIESRWGEGISTHLQTGSGAHPASFAMGTASFCGVKQQKRGVNYATHLAPRLKKE